TLGCVALLGAAACGSDRAAAADAGGAGDATTDAAGLLDGASDADAPEGADAGDGGDERDGAAHAPLPQVKHRGGPILVAPEGVTVTLPGDPLRARAEAFGDAVTTTAWWSATTHAYCTLSDGGGACVGKGSAGAHVVLGAAPASAYTASDVSALVAARVADGT